ncbi:hypothetical protein BX600DRAFT_515651 [Xylariales sp. PMI_506]|nr:hypothetical protein BX600DRAFT_515651 [Xylariales sp. PMI_506]
MATVTIHRGLYEDIPADSSAGLLFLKELLPSYDALGKPPVPVRDFFAEGSKVLTNSNDASPIGQVLQGLIKRVERLSKLYHEGVVAYDIASSDGSHTVIFESYNIRTFKKDPEAREVRVKEVTTFELKPTGDGGLLAVEIRTVMENHAITQITNQIVHSG